MDSVLERKREKRTKLIQFVSFLSLLLIPAFPLSSVAEQESSDKPLFEEQQKEHVSPPLPEPASEEQTPDYEYTEPDFGEDRVSYPFLVLRTIAVLAAIVLGIYFLFRILLKNRNRVVSDTDIIKVLATYPIAANRFIQIVDIAGQILVLGVTESNINLIASVEDKEVIDTIKLASSKKTAETSSFKEQFLKLLGGGKAFTRAGQISYLSGYKKRINKMKKL